ncbi:hypothetical protein D052_3398 [Vibrio parahaemolyticus 10290]|nr:hypothetical protein D052_3398 [Vibrio parahaemolyticus 10290]
MYRQTHRAELQPKTDSRLPYSVSTKEQKGQVQNFGLKTVRTKL